MLADVGFYAKPASEVAKVTERRGRLADRLALAEAAWMEAAGAYEQAAGT